MHKYDELLKERKLFLYGLSLETEKVIKDWEYKYRIIGLLDGFRTDGEQFGYPIFDIKDIVDERNIAIIVVARPGSCKAITKRIGQLCIEKDVPVFDIRGKDLLQDNRVVYDFKNVDGYRYSDLIETAEKYDVISFDLFDTLVVRNIASCTDVVELLYAGFTSDFKSLYPDFVNKRLAAEKKLSHGGNAPKLKDIYADFLGAAIAEKMAAEEFKTDLKLLHSRKEMIKAYEEIKAIGKIVYITSDTYYSENQIKEILTINGIAGYSDLVLSCENDTSKSGNLYEILKRYTGTDRILHIGDDIVSDGEKALEHGIDFFHIYSPSELSDLAGGLGLEQYTESISDRIRIGMFTSEIFNSPFQFEDAERKIHVDTSEDIGYLICAPMINDFVSWFSEMVQDDRYSDIWFCARDGYLIKKLYELKIDCRESKYFLTSRIASVRSCVENLHDIKAVDDMAFSGSLSDKLKTRFGIADDEVSECERNAEESGLNVYSRGILSAARQKKSNYIKYIDSLNPGKGDIAFFDFVARGTNQMYTQRLVKNHLCGLYFLQLEPEYMKENNLEIVSFYTEDERLESVIFDDFYILETILTAPTPSVVEFDEDADPIFAEETRPEDDINCFMKVQEGIIDYIEKYLSICPPSERIKNKKLDEVFIQLIHKVDIRDSKFKCLKVEDPFFNRMTNIMDVI